MNQEQALFYIQSELSSKSLQRLGEGNEAIVFTDQIWVYKFFTQWDKEHTKTLLDCVTKINAANRRETIYALKIHWRSDEMPIIIYPFEKSEPYEGGHRDAWIRFLQETKDAGFVMNNIHPDNFRVVNSELRLIDYGKDLKPWTDEGFLHMARRVYLTLTCFNRSDLKMLMRIALTTNVPELESFQDFLSELSNDELPFPLILPELPIGLSPIGQEMTLDTRVISLTLAQEPQTVLDYGCGKGKITEQLGRKGLQVSGWDVDPERLLRCRNYKSQVRYVEQLSEIETENFDVVICSIVACIVPESEIRELLQNLQQFVSDSGKIIFSICHPFFDGYNSEIHQRELPQNANYQNCYEYTSIPRTTQRKIKDYHRPWSWYLRAFSEAGLQFCGFEESQGIATETGLPSPDYLIAILKPLQKPIQAISLIIRACALDAATIEVQICHITKQLSTSNCLKQRIVAVDKRQTDFPRSYCQPDLSLLLQKLEQLKQQEIIDQIIFSPETETELAALNQRWFSSSKTLKYAQNGQPVATALAAFEQCQHEFIVAIDADILMCRKPNHNPIQEAISILQQEPNAVSVSLNILQSKNKSWSSHDVNGKPWRIEVRAAIFKRQRLLATLPLENSVIDGKWQYPWHRALDRKLQSDQWTSWRGGNCGFGFVHPPNNLKVYPEWLEVLDRLESGNFPVSQVGNVDLLADGDWYLPKRTEEFVFIICGRNVEPPYLKRCLDSVLSQNLSKWGAIIFDDASDTGTSEYLDLISPTLDQRFTIIRNRKRQGSLANLHQAIHHYVANPESIILTLDADDCLYGKSVLQRIAKEYDNGADVTVGSMFRTDKPQHRYDVNLVNPRENRGGNVWQHLRTFKKRLFERIQLEDLKLNGQWIELAADWAFMLPIIEMAENPVHIKEKLYYYEPSRDKMDADKKHEREKVIEYIVSKPRYSRFR